jgi:hypothetical protein
MATQGFINSRVKEHLDSQDKDIARKSSRPKVHALVTHPGMSCPTRSGGPGGPTQGNPPDASGPLPTDPSRVGKSFVVPQVTHGHKSDQLRGHYDPGFAEAVMSEAYCAPDDFAKKLHTVLPSAVSEN